ncbi:MAG: hypothetical protein WAK37_19165, partial [Pseudolabrys sp.]
MPRSELRGRNETARIHIAALRRGGYVADRDAAVRLVYLAELSPEATPRLWNLLREELRSRGWTEGANLTITPRWGAQLSDALAHELVTLKPDAIVAWATPAVAAAQR